jgi:hypothetical protein
VKHPVWIIVLALAFFLTNGAGIPDFFDFSLTSTALAKKPDDDDDDDDDDDECDPSDDEYGLCANQGFVTIKGMTNNVWAHGTTGSLWVEVTSSNVHVETESGDIFAMGLTEKGKFKSDTGHIKVHYCQEPAGTSDGLKITSLSTGDVDIRFLEGTQFNFDITTSGILKNRMGDCDSCSFKLKGEITGNTFISEILLADDTTTHNCLY